MRDSDKERERERERGKKRERERKDHYSFVTCQFQKHGFKWGLCVTLRRGVTKDYMLMVARRGWLAEAERTRELTCRRANS